MDDPLGQGLLPGIGDSTQAKARHQVGHILLAGSDGDDLHDLKVPPDDSVDHSMRRPIRFVAEHRLVAVAEIAGLDSIIERNVVPFTVVEAYRENEGHVGQIAVDLGDRVDIRSRLPREQRAGRPFPCAH